MLKKYWIYYKEGYTAMAGIIFLGGLVAIFSEMARSMLFAGIGVIGIVVCLFGIRDIWDSSETYQYIDNDIGSLPRSTEEQRLQLLTGIINSVVGIGMWLTYWYILAPFMPNL